jgi:hypothetical protein
MSVSYPLNSATLANPTTPFYGGGGPAPPPPSSNGINVLSSTTVGQAFTNVTPTVTVFTFPAVTVAGKYLIQGQQIMVVSGPAVTGSSQIVVNKNGTGVPGAIIYSSAQGQGVQFYLAVDLLVGDVLTVTALPGFSGTFGTVGVANIKQITVP